MQNSWLRHASFRTLNISFHCLLTFMVSDEKSAVDLAISFLIHSFLISLNISQIVDLKSLSTKSNIWASLGTVSIDFVFPCPQAILCFFACLIILLLKTLHFGYYNVAIMEIRFSPFPRVFCCCWGLLLLLFLVTSELMLKSMYSIINGH